MKRALLILWHESLRAASLAAALCFVVALLVVHSFSLQRPGEFFFSAVGRYLAHIHLTRAELPVWPVLRDAAWATLPPAAAAVGLLIALSTIAGSIFALSPWGRLLKPAVIACSVVPAFMWPFVGYLLDPELTFHGFNAATATFWPALALAVGDMNWITVSTGFADSLQRELAEPHTRMARVLGQRVLLQVWPKALIGLVAAVASRVPHLLGGMVAIEVLFNIPGLGYLAWQSILATPPDYAIVLWVCLIGVLVSHALSLLHQTAKLLLFPEAALGRIDDSLEPPEPLLADSRSDESSPSPSSVSSFSAISSASSSETATPTTTPTVAARPAVVPPGWLPWRAALARVRFYLAVHPSHWIKLGMATWIWCVAALVFLALWFGTGEAPLAPPGGALQQFRPSDAEHPLGTNAADDDVFWMLGAGLRQQRLPLLLALGVCVAAAPLAALDLISRLLPSRFFRFAARAAFWLSGLLALLIESVPRIVILLAGFYLFDGDQLTLKLYLLIGVAFFPQIHRAVRDDLSALDHSLFLEASRVAGVPWWRTAWQNVLRNHSLQMIAVQSAVVVGSIVHADAMLGFLGIRNRGVMLTWGSVLGTGVSEFQSFRALEGVKPGFWFNDGVVWGPFLAIWLAILTAITLADALRIPVTGYVYRLK